VELGSINPWIIIAACIMQIATIYLVSFQWYLLANRVSENVKYKSVFHLNMVGSLVEAVTPAAKAGGEAVKIVILKKSMDFSYAKALSLVSMQKIISVVPFLILCLSGIVWFLSTFTGDQRYSNMLLGSFFFLLLVSLVLVLALVLLNRFSVSAERFPFIASLLDKIKLGISTIKIDLMGVLQNKGQLTFHLFLSFGIWIFFAVKAYFIAYAMGLPITLLQIGIITYLTYMVAMVPLLPGGLGTFEAAMVLLLALLGIPLYQAITFALVFRFTTFWFVFIWSGIYLLYYNMTNKARENN